ncbi:MAG: hypothetical protein Q7S76_00475 [bacterium]|nr:hypothetical protein [bacterium]
MEILIPIIISIIALVVAVLSWHKNRVHYGIRIEHNAHGEQKVNDLLNTGKYTILHVSQDPLNKLRNVYVLGKVKK